MFDRFHDNTSHTGFLYLSNSNPWPEETEKIIERLPDDWLEVSDGSSQIRRDRYKYLLKSHAIRKDGCEDNQGIQIHFISAPFRFCLNCGVSYDFRQSNDFGKLSTIGTGGAQHSNFYFKPIDNSKFKK